MRVTYTPDSVKLAIIGDPVAHSMSPVVQNTMIEVLGLNCIYLAQRIAPYQISDWISAAVLLEFGGFNATMPHKTNLMPFMDVLSEDARLFGAVNTVVIRKRECYGYNTDGDGFIRSLAAQGVTPDGRRAVVLGAGGAARSVVLKLARLGAEKVTVCCRTQSQGEAIRALNPSNIEVEPLTPDVLRTILPLCDLLVNCTPIGMHGVKTRFADLTVLDALPGHAVVYDTIYNPSQTELLAEASARGHQTVNGLGMLIHQGILALELFADVSIDPNLVMQPVCDALAKALPG